MITGIQNEMHVIQKVLLLKKVRLGSPLCTLLTCCTVTIVSQSSIDPVLGYFQNITHKLHPDKSATQSKVTIFLGRNEETRELKRMLDKMHHELNQSNQLRDTVKLILEHSR